MPEPLLKILARFDINEELGTSSLDGRAYVSAFNFKQAYNSDLNYAIKKLREVVKSPELEHARNRLFNHTIAIMWGSTPKANETSHQMIDFLGWKYDSWAENAEISAWQTDDGKVIQPRNEISLVTCEGGEDILHAEKKYRHSGVSPVSFKICPPIIEEIGLDHRYDFCSPNGRKKLAQILYRGSFIMEDQ